MTPEWLPNWRDPEAYPADLTPDQWRWEFLRRREDYQADWEKYREIFVKKELPKHENHPLPPGVTSWGEHFRNIATVTEIKRTELTTNETTIERRGCCKKYGVKYFLNPAVGSGELSLVLTQKHINFFSRKSGFFAYFITEDRAKQLREDGIWLYAFDITKPINEQLKDAKLKLESLQEEIYEKPVARRHTKKWPLYLRVLDARTTGEKWQSIGEELQLIDDDRLAKNGLKLLECAPRARQIYDQAIDLMFKLTA